MPAGSYDECSLYRIERAADGFTAIANHGGLRDTRHNIDADASTTFEVGGAESDADAFLELELFERPPLWEMEIGDRGRIIEMREIPPEKGDGQRGP